MALKEKYPGTKAMIAVGGWTHNEPDNERLYRFSESAATPRARATFAQSSVAFMRKYGFDGYVLSVFFLVIMCQTLVNPTNLLQQSPSHMTLLFVLFT